MNLRDKVEEIVLNRVRNNVSTDRTIAKLISLFEQVGNEIIGEDENSYTVQIVHGQMTGLVKSTGEEIPLRLQLKEQDQNELKSEQRSRLKEICK